jgi:hypothetical protein
MKNKSKTLGYDFIIFHNLFTRGESLEHISTIFAKIPFSVKIIISESLISQKEKNLDKIIKKISEKRKLNKIAFSSGAELKKRNKFYVFDKC